MTNRNIVEQITIAAIVITAWLIGYATGHSQKINKESFYDGEGNTIPISVVQLEVKSHFVKLKQQEKDSVNKYFYFDTLK